MLTARRRLFDQDSFRSYRGQILGFSAAGRDSELRRRSRRTRTVLSSYHTFLADHNRCVGSVPGPTSWTPRQSMRLSKPTGVGTRSSLLEPVGISPNITLMGSMWVLQTGIIEHTEPLAICECSLSTSRVRPVFALPTPVGS
jgi:hypothetical protein